MKKLVKILIGAVCAIVLALIIVPFFIPAETYKNALIAQVRKMTGRELTIAGNASLRLLPNVALNVEDVTLSNPAGFADKDLTHIGKLSVDVALKPLFDKRVEMRGATLEDAVIALEEREDGIKSWELMPAVKGTETDASPKEKSAKKDMSKIILGSVSIKNSKMIYRKAGKPPIELSDINLTVDSQGFASKLTADLEAVYKGEKIAIDATVENPEQFLNAKATALEVTAKAPATEVSFKGEGAMGDALVAMGNLSASVSDLPKLTGWATGKPSGAKPKSINAKGRFASNPLWGDGWGWALWNFRGGFGVLDSQRSDVTYETWEGHPLDRAMLELLQKH